VSVTKLGSRTTQPKLSPPSWRQTGSPSNTLVAIFAAGRSPTVPSG